MGQDDFKIFEEEKNDNSIFNNPLDDANTQIQKVDYSVNNDNAGNDSGTNDSGNDYMTGKDNYYEDEYEDSEDLIQVGSVYMNPENFKIRMIIAGVCILFAILFGLGIWYTQKRAENYTEPVTPKQEPDYQSYFDAIKESKTNDSITYYSLQNNPVIEQEPEVFEGILRYEADIKGLDTKRKSIDSEDDTFVEDFLKTYGEYETETVKLDLKDYIKPENTYVNAVKVTEYDYGDNKIAYVMEEQLEEKVGVTCIYIDWNETEEFAEDNLGLYGSFPKADDPAYDFTVNNENGYEVKEYNDNVDNFSDSGYEICDEEGHVLYWNHYLTSGSRQMYLIWDENGVATLIDTGGMAYGPDPDDYSIEVGISTTAYRFNPSVPFEDLTLH